MNLVFVDGVLFSGDYDGIVKKWDVSKSGKKNWKLEEYMLTEKFLQLQGLTIFNLFIASNKYCGSFCG